MHRELKKERKSLAELLHTAAHFKHSFLKTPSDTVGQCGVLAPTPKRRQQKKAFLR